MKINKLFVVSKNKMLLKAIEIACKNSEKDFFTIDNFDEAVHFVEDIKPDVVVIDTSDALLESEEFQKNMNSNFKVVKLIKKNIKNGIIIGERNYCFHSKKLNCLIAKIFR